MDPKHMYEAYRDGLPGCIDDPAATELFLANSNRPLFGAAAYDLMGSGAGQKALLYEYMDQVDPDYYTEEAQTTGDCTAKGSHVAVDTNRLVDIFVKNELEAWLGRTATSPTYGMRRHGGQGMAVIHAVRYLSEEGGYLLRKNYPDLGVDLSVYNSKIGHNWGRSGTPAAVTAKAREHQVGTASLCTTVEEARDAIYNGYCLTVGSNVGFSKKRDAEGFSRPQGNWMHNMAWIGMDFEYSRPGFLVVNTWGRWNSGPKRHRQPNGSFWIDADVAQRMLSQRSGFVLSGTDGFPPRRLPNMRVFG